MKYANFWQRFGAILIDGFVLLPFSLLHYWLQSFSRTIAMILVVPMAAAYCAYTIYGHARFGQTVGKYAMHIRVVRTNGERIGWREAWLRSSVDIGFTIPWVIALFIALAAISDQDYASVSRRQRTRNLNALKPTWDGWVSKADQIWFWSELIVMLFNKRRRALHDFIAGTVVTETQRISDAHLRSSVVDA
jgi:uncharacterized RDD family membrane protein YckC